MVRRWPGWATAVWAFGFAGLNVFWALGGRTGLHPVEDAMGIGPVNLAAAAIKVVLGVVALVAVRRVPGPRPAARGIALGVGVVLTLYGLYETVGNALVVAGALPGVEAGPNHVHYVWLWGPIWLLGGLLHLAVARALRPR
ncbi:DUF3995 domain-containing protein [Saccharopolyspora sp. CA-218241]|uniref:DUF3995 domain-containing protein n=1 Tax=Saccharopolyspora sp. CA-218241 TaxID=3240027 RepID=UPI003D951D1D